LSYIPELYVCIILDCSQNIFYISKTTLFQLSLILANLCQVSSLLQRFWFVTYFNRNLNIMSEAVNGLIWF